MLAKALLMRKNNSVDNLIDPDVVLPACGWTKQDDGSFYVANASMPCDKIIWQNTEGYTGQLKVSYDIKYLTSADRGVIMHALYTDNTAWRIRDTIGTYTEFNHKEFTSDSTKVVRLITTAYTLAQNSTWIKNLIISKV